MGSLRDVNALYYSERPIHWSQTTKVLGFHICADRQHMQDLNFNELLQKMHTVLTPWTARSLTLLGRILVVNTLVISLGTQKLTCLPTPKNEFFATAKKIVTEFIWKGAPTRIAYNKLVQQISQGGMGLTDLRTKEIALKTSWIKKSNNNTPHMWKLLASKILPAPLPQIWQHSTLPEDIHVNMRISNSIWESIWKAWAELIKADKPKLDPKHILRENIALNSNIKIDNRVIKPGTYGTKSLTQLADLGPTEQRHIHFQFYTFDQINQLHPTCRNYLHYYAMLSAITQEWKATLRSQPCNTGEIKNWAQEYLEEFTKKYKVATGAYKLLLPLKLPHMDESRIKWNFELKLDISEDQWHKIRLYNYKLPTAVKLKDFQLQLYANKITTNILRSKYDSSVAETCTFCMQEKETCTHLFYHCNVIKKIWIAMEKWVKYYFNVTVQFTPEFVMLKQLYRGTKRFYQPKYASRKTAYLCKEMSR